MAGAGASLFASAMVAVVVAMVSVGSAGGAAAPAPDCTSALNALVPCYTYVTGSVATPPPDCCSGLSSLNKDNPTCLCNLITTELNSSTATSGVNMTKAYSLPKDCSITLNTTTCPALANLPGTTPTPTTPASGPSSSIAPASTSAAPSLMPSQLVIVAAAALLVVVEVVVQLF